MGWPSPSLDSVILSHDTGGKRWLHALCLALNEREGCLGLTKTQFIKGDGTEGSNLTVGDLTGLWIGGANDGAITNLNRCMAGLKAMLTSAVGGGGYGHFKSTSGSSGSTLDLAALQTAVGLGSFPDAANGWTDLNFWKQLQQAFDLLIYARKRVLRTGGTASRRFGFGDGSFTTAGLEIAWDNAKAATPGSVSINTYGLRWHVLDGNTVEFRTGPVTIFFPTTGMSGAITESYYNVRLGLRTEVLVPTAWISQWTIGTETYAGPVAGPVATTELALNSSNSKTFDIDQAIPANVPAGFGNGFYGIVDLAEFYYDLAGVLEDQS